MRVGIFGGTFDPVHNGHVKAAQAFFTHAGLDMLYVIPDKIPPHKSIGAGDDPTLRFQMARLAFEENPAFQGRVTVSDLEMNRKEPSYTYLTVRTLREQGLDDLFLYCGTDMLLTLHEWRHAEEFIPLCTVAYAEREYQDAVLSARVVRQKALLCERYGAKILDIPLDPIEISSSEIREMIAGGGDASAYLPPRVYEFIKERGLYQ